MSAFYVCCMYASVLMTRFFHGTDPGSYYFQHRLAQGISRPEVVIGGKSLFVHVLEYLRLTFTL